MWASRSRIMLKSQLQILILILNKLSAVCLALRQNADFAGYLNKSSDPVSIKAEDSEALWPMLFSPAGLGISVLKK
jgi:hypothetical protein